MTQTLHQNDIHDLVQDRIGDLYATASELRETRRQAPETITASSPGRAGR